MVLQTQRTSQEPKEEYIPPLDITNVIDDANHEDLDREVAENDTGVLLVCITTTEGKMIKILISLGATAAPAPV